MRLNSCEINKIQKRQTADSLFFGFAEAVKICMPSVSEDKIIDLFVKRFDIDEGEISRNAIKVEYSRMKQEIIDSMKSE